MIDLKNEEQAALLLLALEPNQAGDVLRSLGREQVQSIVRTMASMGTIKNHQLDQALCRFFSDFQELSGISRAPREFLEQTLQVALGSELARGVIDEVYGEQIRERMHQLQWLEPGIIANILRRELSSIQTSFLAFLPQETSSLVLAAMPVENHEALVMQMASLQEVNPTVIRELNKLIDRCLEQLNQGTYASVEGVKQAANLLARYGGNSEVLLNTIRGQDAQLAEEIEARMFDFSILERQSEDVIMKLCQEIEPELWAKALKGSHPSLRQTIFSSLSKRQASAIEDQMQALGPQPASAVEEACSLIMNRVRELVMEGEVEIRLFEEKVVE
ncbi:MAG: FliG C-terminal domain-containing protein [Aeromonas sobria]